MTPQWRIRSLLLVAVALVTGVALQGLAGEFIPGSWWAHFFGALGPAVAIGGGASIVADLLLRHSFYSELSTLIDIQGDLSQLYGSGVRPWEQSSPQHGGLDQEVASGQDLLVALNTGESFVTEYRGPLRDRFAAQLPMALILADPSSNYARALEVKEFRPRDDLSTKLGQTLRSIEEIGGTDETVTVYLHKLICSFSVWSTSKATFIHPYGFSATRIINTWFTAPPLICVSNTDSSAPHNEIRRDLKAFIDSEDYRARNNMVELSLSRALEYAEGLRHDHEPPRFNSVEHRGKEVLNMTGHDLRIYAHDGVAPGAILTAVGGGVRVQFAEDEGSDLPIGSVLAKVRNCGLYEIVNLPEVDSDQCLIVSTLVALLSGRDDILFPTGHVRGENGHVIGNTGFGRFDATLRERVAMMKVNQTEGGPDEQSFDPGR